MGFSNTLPVKVWSSSEECKIGHLSIRNESLTIELESGQIITSANTNSDTQYEIQHKLALDHNGQSKIEHLEVPLRIKFEPHLIIRHTYTNQGIQFLEDIFPPSTAGFYGRLQAGKQEAVYLVQKIVDSDQFWLYIYNPETGHIFESFAIQLYEAEALSLVEDNRIRQALFKEAASNRAKSIEEIFSILDEPSPSWNELSQILDDVSVPNLKLGKTMRDTLTQIVPSSFPIAIRNELMTFLAYVIRGKIPEEDPLTYYYQFSSTTILEYLLSGHLIHLIDGTEYPPYVKLMTLAERGQLDFPKRAVSESIRNSPWLLFTQKCAEQTPNWLDIAVKSAMKLNDAEKIILSLPTTKASATRTRKAWKQRFAEMSHGLRVYGHINPSSLGLIELVYLGSAYRWSHRHMKFIIRLGGAGENTPHMQIMIVPISIVERIKRALPSIMNISWSSRMCNLPLYDSSQGKWDVPTDQIIESIEKKSSIKKLKKEFGSGTTSGSYRISQDEVKVVDLIAEGVELSFLEIPEFLANWDFDETKSRRIVSNLVKKKIMKLTYEVADTSLVSLATIIQGTAETVSSVVRGFLKNTPTSYARIDETGNSAVILSRLPEGAVFDISSQLTSKGLENDVNIRCMRPTTFRRYTSNLYQRLLRDDGTWDDDVSAFLSQARSKRKELSESNP